MGLSVTGTDTKCRRSPGPLLGAVAAFRYLLVFTVAKHTIAPRNSTGAVAVKSNSLSNGDITDDLECLHFAPPDFKFGTLTYHSKSHLVDNNKKLSPRDRAMRRVS